MDVVSAVLYRGALLLLLRESQWSSDTRRGLLQMCRHANRAASPAPLVVTISGVTYDISGWVDKHPGGTVITAGCGLDATALFLSHHCGASLPKAQAVLAKLPVLKQAPLPVPCDGVERVSEHYAALAAEAKAVQLKSSNTALLDWLVGVAGVLLLAFSIARSRLHGDLLCSLSMLVLSRVSDGYLHAAGHGQRFQVPLPFKWFCTAFHYTFGQAPYGHGGLYYYYPGVTRPWRGTHFGHHLVTNTADDFEHTELYDLPSCAKHAPGAVLHAAVTSQAGFRTACVALACSHLAPSSHPLLRALPYLAGAWWQWRPHVVKTASILRSIAAGTDTERPDPAAFKLFAWFSHLLVGADGPGLLMWFTCTPLVASLYPVLGGLVFDLLWVPVFGLSQHSLFNAVRSEQDGMQRAAVPWDVQQVLTSADCIATGVCRLYDALCMHADTYQTTHHLFPAVHWSHMPALQPRVERWCREHGHPYSAVTDVQGLVDWYTAAEPDGKVHKRRRAP